MNDLVRIENKLTMSSREIAELTGKRHDHVMRDIKVMLEALGKDTPKFGAIYKDTYGRDQNEFILDRELTLTLVSGYIIPLRHKVVRRLAALEKERSAVSALPDFTNPAESARAWAEQYESRRIAESKISVLAPKADALDRMSIADGEVCLQTAGKLLQQQPNKFIQWLRSLNTWIFKRAGSARYSAYTDKINAGYLAVKTVTTIMPDGHERVTEQVVVTPKGLAKLALLLGVQIPHNGDLFHTPV